MATEHNYTSLEENTQSALGILGPIPFFFANSSLERPWFPAGIGSPQPPNRPWGTFWKAQGRGIEGSCLSSWPQMANITFCRIVVARDRKVQSNTLRPLLASDWGFKLGQGRANDLLSVVYGDLRRQAHRLRRRNPKTLETTALVHETAVRLLKGPNVNWDDRAHFLALASRAMRQVVADQRAHMIVAEDKVNT